MEEEPFYDFMVPSRRRKCKTNNKKEKQNEDEPLSSSSFSSSSSTTTGAAAATPSPMIVTTFKMDTVFGTFSQGQLSTHSSQNNQSCQNGTKSRSATAKKNSKKSQNPSLLAHEYLQESKLRLEQMQWRIQSLKADIYGQVKQQQEQKEIDAESLLQELQALQRRVAEITVQRQDVEQVSTLLLEHCSNNNHGRYIPYRHRDQDDGSARRRRLMEDQLLALVKEGEQQLCNQSL